MSREIKAIYIEHGRRVVYFKGARNSRQLYARFLIEESQGIKLSRKDHVHHKDENKLNDSLDNLEVLNIKEHAKLHSTGKIFPDRRTKKVKSCGHCKKNFMVAPSRYDRTKYCSTICRQNENALKPRLKRRDSMCFNCGKPILNRSKACRSCSQRKEYKVLYV